MSAPALDRPGRLRIAYAARPPLARDVSIGIGLALLYGLIGWVSNQRLAFAVRTGRWFLDLERHLGLDLEVAANRWLTGHPTLTAAASYEYAVTYVVTSFGLLGWLWLRRPGHYPMARSSFMLLNAAAMTIFLVLPTAPPRLLPGEGFVDSVQRSGTPGSWGSGFVSELADRVGAMPSLHVAWAVWFFLVVARVTRSRWAVLLSALHIGLTVLVIVTTANHYLLDAVAGAGLAMATTLPFAGRTHPGRRVVTGYDALFWHVEDGGVPQTVGGVVPVPADLELAAVRRDLTAHLPDLELLRRVPVRSRWRRTAYTVLSEVDPDAHLREVTVGGGDDPAAVDAAVADLVRRPLPAGRPPWLFALLRTGDGRAVAGCFVLHHALADGPGAVQLIAEALGRPAARRVPLPAATAAGPRRRARLTGAGELAGGLARLALAGRAPRAHGRARVRPGAAYARGGVPMTTVRLAARRHGVGPTEVVVTAAVRALGPAVGGDRLRISVPAAQRTGGRERQVGAVLVDLPVGGPPADLLAAVADGLRSPGSRSEVAAAALAVRVAARLPAVLNGVFVRRVYGWRHFNAIVSVFPGGGQGLRVGGRPVPVAHPILPLADGVPLALGAMRWGGELTLAATTDPGVLDAAELVDRITAVIGELAAVQLEPTA